MKNDIATDFQKVKESGKKEQRMVS